MTVEQRKNFLSLVVIVTIGGLMAATWWQLEILQRQIAQNDAILSAEKHVEALESFRTLYTSEVVARVPEDTVQVVHNFQDIDNAIPLPATMTIRLGETIGRGDSGLQVRLFSQYPFPWREDGTLLDDFELNAITALENDPDKPFFAFEEQDGKSVLRYAKADRMRPSCVSCHNSHPDSPKTDWLVDDVRGVLAVALPVGNIDRESSDVLRTVLFLQILAGGILVGAILWVYRRLSLGS